jgi:hypothetical protein
MSSRRRENRCFRSGSRPTGWWSRWSQRATFRRFTSPGTTTPASVIAWCWPTSSLPGPSCCWRCTLRLGSPAGASRCRSPGCRRWMSPWAQPSARRTLEFCSVIRAQRSRRWRGSWPSAACLACAHSWCPARACERRWWALSCVLDGRRTHAQRSLGHGQTLIVDLNAARPSDRTKVASGLSVALGSGRRPRRD